MNRYSKIIAFLMLSVLFLNSNALAQQGDSETRVFKVKEVDLVQLFNAISIFRSVPGVQMMPVAELGVISVIAPRSVMAAIERVITELDVPPPPKKTIELTLHLLRATERENSAVMPNALLPVVNQLRNIFSYRGFEVIDTQIVRGTDGKSLETSGTLPELVTDGTVSLPPPVYQFSSTLALRSVDQKDIVAVQKLYYAVKVPTVTVPDPATRNAGWQYVNVNITTDVEVPVGQQVVVGKTTVGNSALILVISVKL